MNKSKHSSLLKKNDPQHKINSEPHFSVDINVFSTANARMESPVPNPKTKKALVRSTSFIGTAVVDLGGFLSKHLSALGIKWLTQYLVKPVSQSSVTLLIDG